MVFAAGLKSEKLAASNTLSGELAISFSCLLSTFVPIPREYTLTFLFLSPRAATDGSVYGPRSVVCSPSVIKIAI